MYNMPPQKRKTILSKSLSRCRDWCLGIGTSCTYSPSYPDIILTASCSMSVVCNLVHLLWYFSLFLYLCWDLNVVNFVQSSTNLGKEKYFPCLLQNMPSKRLERQMTLEMDVVDLGTWVKVNMTQKSPPPFILLEPESISVCVVDKKPFQLQETSVNHISQWSSCCFLSFYFFLVPRHFSEGRNCCPFHIDSGLYPGDNKG